MGTEEGLVKIFITSLPLFFLISTDGIIPSLFLTLFGRSSNNFFASFIPTGLPLSSMPIINFPPSALAKAQITLRYSSLQLDLYSVFWLSINICPFCTHPDFITTHFQYFSISSLFLVESNIQAPPRRP